MRELYYLLLEHPEYCQTGVWREQEERPDFTDPEDPPEQRTVDIVAGMTDPYALELYKRYFFPESWPA